MKKPDLLRLFFVAALACLIISACKNTVITPHYTVNSSAALSGGFGDTIVINGTGLQQATGFTIIKLNGKIFSIVTSSDGYLKAIVPKGAGNGQITISLNGNVFNGPMFTYKYKAVVTTVAGSGTAGFADGTGAAASFNQPWGLALDASNNLYVCDESNRAIRIVTPDSSVTSITFPATFNGVSFYAPYNIAINQTTNALYVTDFNAQLMAISNESASIIYNGTAPTTGIAVASDGSLYMSNNSTGTILKLSADGLTVTPFASGIGAPRNIVFDKTGNMFVAGFDATKNSSAIFQVSSTGVATVLYDDPGFKGYDIATDGNGTFYEADYFGNTIRMIDPSGNITVIAGSGTAADTDGIALKASFNGPHGITVDAIGEIYVSTFNPSTGGGNKIRKVVLE